MNKHNHVDENQRKRRMWVLWGAFAVACGGQLAGPIVGGESHFLRHCSSSCDEGLSCISGVCTQSCLVDDADGCSSLSPAARCTNTTVEPGNVAICDIGCQHSTDCSHLGTDYSCESGYCRGLARTSEGGLSSGGSALGMGSGGAPVVSGSGGASVQTGAGGSSGGTPQEGSGGALPTEYPGQIPSCEDLESTCAGGNCCTSLLVPAGRVSRDGYDYEMPAFYLDKFEVTVGRFRKYMEAVDAWMEAGNPVEGAGAVPLAPDSGFKRAWLEGLEPDYAVGVRPGWLGVTKEDGPIMTMGNPTYLFAERDDLAVNRVPFHAAFAFCIWDGGRLPSALEWRFVAQAGPSAAPYPWGNESAVDVFATAPTTAPQPGFENDPEWEYLVIPVGSHPQSVGWFGHHDLVGGMDEWVRDDTLDVMDARVRLGEDSIVKNPFELQLPMDRVIFGSNWAMVTRAAGYSGTPLPPSGWNTGLRESSATSSLDGIRCARDW